MEKNGKIEDGVSTVQTPTTDVDDTVDAYLKDAKNKANTLNKEVWKSERLAEQKANDEAFKKIIKTEKAVLKALDPKKRLIIRTEFEGSIIEFKVRSIESVSDPKDMDWLALDERVYMDSEELKKEIMTKKNQKKKLNSVEDKSNIKDKLSELEKMNRFLAIFIYPPSFNKFKDREERNAARLAFWESQPLNFKKFLIERASELLGLDLEKEFKLFRVD